MLTVWSDSLVDKMTALWLEGLSARQIAAELGNDISHNAVISKLHRIGLTSKNRHDSELTRVPRVKSSKRFTFTTRAVFSFKSKVIPTGVPLKLLIGELQSFHCRYIVEGEKEHSLYCGLRVHKDSSWCPGHHAIVYARPPEPKPAAVPVAEAA